MPTPRFRLGRVARRLAPVLLAALPLGCGGDEEARSAARWCQEEGAEGAAEVTIRRELQEDGSWLETGVVLSDEERRTLLHVSSPRVDGAFQRIVYVRDEAGNVIEELRDSGGDGVAETVHVNTYDEAGRPTVTTVDFGNDGTVDSVSTWDYSTAGQSVRRNDYDLDGEPNSIYVAFYSDRGDLVREEFDADADGTVDTARSFLRSDDGLMLVEAEDVDGDGIDESSLMHEYDDEGRLVHSRSDVTGDGMFDSVVTCGYDDSGSLVSRTYADADGTINRTTYYAYDEQGRTVRTESFARVDGPLEWAVEDEYDETTVPVRTGTDEDGDGDWDSVTTRTACE